MTSRDDRTVLQGADLEPEALADWRILFDQLQARFRTGSFAAGLALVQQIAEEAEASNHHPDLELTYPAVRVRLSSHDVGGVTARDVRLARRISELAAAAGVPAEPASVQVLELALDTEDLEAIKPFWRAVLGLADSGRPDELVDPLGVLPTLWFQQTDPHSPPRQRFHLDVRVPPEVAQERVAAALEAGGTLVSDDVAPRFWVVSDAQGNKACVTTWQDR